MTESIQNPETPEKEEQVKEPIHKNEKFEKTVNVLKKIFGGSSSGFRWLYLAAFFLSSSFVPNTLVLYGLKKPVIGLLTVVFLVSGYIGFVACVLFYFKKTTEGEPLKFRERIASGGLASLVVILLMYVITTIFAFVYRILIGYSPALMQLDTKAFVFIGVLTITLTLLLWVLFSSVVLLCAVFQYSISVRAVGSVYGTVVRGLLRNFLWALVYSLGAGVLFYGVNIAHNVILEGVSAIMQPGFYKTFVFYILAAGVTSGYFYWVIKMARKLLRRMEQQVVQSKDKVVQKSVPKFVVALGVLGIVMTVMLVPIGANSADAVMAEVDLHMQKGEALKNMGLTQKAIYEYDQGYSKLLSLKGYLQGIEGIKDSNPNVMAESEKTFNEGIAITAKNPYSPYFKGQLYLLNGNPESAIAAFKSAVAFKNGVSGAYLGLLDAYSQKKQEESVAETLQVLANMELYSDSLESIKNMSIKKIDAMLIKIEEQEDRLGPKMVYKAVEKSKYGDDAGTLKDLLDLQKEYPKDPAISYYIAKIASNYREESSNYDVVKTYTKAFETQTEGLETPEDQVNRALFAAQMYTGAEDLEAAEKVLEQTYHQQPGNFEIARQYAYVLMADKATEDALNVIEGILTQSPQDIEALYLKAMCLMDEEDSAASLEVAQTFVQEAEAVPESAAILDKLIYTYCLEFNKTFKKEEDIKGVERVQNTALLYNYLKAIEGWRAKDAKASSEAIDQVIKAYPHLGYPYFIKGVNAYENTVRTGSTDFEEAERYYLKSVDLLPNHTEGYFALAHCYKKWGKNAEALRAFRKVVDLMPYEDHRYDPYGMSVHAQSEVRNLAQYDTEEGE